MKYLRDKIKTVVKNEDDVNKIMDFVYWETSKLLGTTDRSIANKVRKYLKNGLDKLKLK